MKKIFYITMALVIIVLIITGCSNSINPPDDWIILYKAGTKGISDAIHGGDNEHFYFLPPMVPDPVTSGVFDGSLSPVVIINELIDGNVLGPEIAYFDTEGSGSERVRVDLEDEHYIVNWHTKWYSLDEQKFYRIRVLVGGTELGWADMDVVSSGNKLQSVDTDEYIALKDGRTLPIKFWIGEDGQPSPTEPTITPTYGTAGAPFTIYDPQGRIQAGSLALFHLPGQDPATGFNAENINIPDGNTLTGNVPQDAVPGGNLIAVQPTLGDPPYFEELEFYIK